MHTKAIYTEAITTNANKNKTHAGYHLYVRQRFLRVYINLFAYTYQRMHACCLAIFSLFVLYSLHQSCMQYKYLYHESTWGICYLHIKNRWNAFFQTLTEKTYFFGIVMKRISTHTSIHSEFCATIFCLMKYFFLTLCFNKNNFFNYSTNLSNIQ